MTAFGALVKGSDNACHVAMRPVIVERTECVEQVAGFLAAVAANVDVRAAQTTLYLLDDIEGKRRDKRCDPGHGVMCDALSVVQERELLDVPARLLKVLAASNLPRIQALPGQVASKLADFAVPRTEHGHGGHALPEGIRGSYLGVRHHRVEVPLADQPQRLRRRRRIRMAGEPSAHREQPAPGRLIVMPAGGGGQLDDDT